MQHTQRQAYIYTHREAHLRLFRGATFLIPCSLCPLFWPPPPSPSQLPRPKSEDACRVGDGHFNPLIHVFLHQGFKLTYSLPPHTIPFQDTRPKQTVTPPHHTLPSRHHGSCTSTSKRPGPSKPSTATTTPSGQEEEE